jgi:hypothetical protein
MELEIWTSRDDKSILTYHLKKTGQFQVSKKQIVVSGIPCNVIKIPVSEDICTSLDSDDKAKYKVNFVMCFIVAFLSKHLYPFSSEKAMEEIIITISKSVFAERMQCTWRDFYECK